MTQAQRIPAGLYAELIALRQLRDTVRDYKTRYLLDEIEDAGLCVSIEQHDLACTLAEQLDATLAVEWKGCAAVSPSESAMRTA